MKKHRALLALGILALIAGTFQEAVRSQPASETSRTDRNPPQAPQSEWKVFSSRAGGFSVLMPGTPQETTETKDFPVVGKGVIHLFVLASESGTYVVGYLDIPGLAKQSQSFSDSFGKGFLSSIGDGTANGAGGKVVKETDILFGKDPGKDILLDLPAGHATARAYFIKRRGYQLIAAPSGGEVGNGKKFLDSFKVTAY